MRKSFLVSGVMKYLQDRELMEVCQIYKIQFKTVITCNNLFCRCQHPLIKKEPLLVFSLFNLWVYIVANILIVVLLIPLLCMFWIYANTLKLSIH